MESTKEAVSIAVASLHLPETKENTSYRTNSKHMYNTENATATSCAKDLEKLQVATLSRTRRFITIRLRYQDISCAR
jgi:hypothetical protein